MHIIHKERKYIGTIKILTLQEDLKLRISLQPQVGYTVQNVPLNSSFAGYKDWFILEYNRPGYTIEAGLGQNPLPITQFDEIYMDNFGILVLGMVL